MTRSRSDWVAALDSSTNVWLGRVRADNVAGERFGCEYYGEPMGVAEYVLAVPRRPEIFGRMRDARDGHFLPRGAVEDLHSAARGETERVGGMTFDDNLAVNCGIG